MLCFNKKYLFLLPETIKRDHEKVKRNIFIYDFVIILRC